MSVLFILSNLLRLPHPSLMSNSSPLHAVFTLFFSLFQSSVSSSKTEIIQQRQFFFSFFIFHSPISSLPLPSVVLLWAIEEHLTLNDSSTRSHFQQTSRQTSRGVQLHPKPFMIEQSAKWLTAALNYCHITCSCGSRRASQSQAPVDFLQDLTTEILIVPL